MAKPSPAVHEGPNSTGVPQARPGHESGQSGIKDVVSRIPAGDLKTQLIYDPTLLLLGQPMEFCLPLNDDMLALLQAFSALNNSC